MNADGLHTPAISVVIVNYNVRNLLENCLQSLYSALGGIPSEIFIVDNNSDDGSAGMVRENFPDVTLLALSENIGFARANNKALVQAKGKYILLLNPDTLVQEDTVSKMMEFFDSCPDAGLAGCKIINPDGSIEAACRRSFPSPWVAFTKLSGLSKLFPKSRLFAKYNLTYMDEDSTYEVDAISGSFMFLRREVYDTIGGLDEQYFMYGEDLDWCYRTQQSGWKVYYVPETRIIHYGGESTKRSSIDATYIFYQAMELFAEKNLRISAPGMMVIRAGIRSRRIISQLKYGITQSIPIATDAVIVLLAVLLAEYFRFDALGTLPAHAYPAMYISAIVGVIISLLAVGTYTKPTYRFARAALGVIISFFLLSSATYFVKSFAFSRALVLLSSALNIVALPGYRILQLLRRPAKSSTLVTGKPTLLVGLNDNTQAIIERLRSMGSNSYRLSGIIDTTNARIGELFSGVPVIGTTDNIAKVIREKGITDVIIVPDILSYGQILSMISRTRGSMVHFRIVPKSMDAVVGKAHIDQLMSVPLVDIEYNLLRTPNKLMKRLLDLAVALPLLIGLYPFVSFSRKRPSKPCTLRSLVLATPAIVSGRKSLVGYPESLSGRKDVYLGLPGITGIAQLRKIDPNDTEEILSLSVQYVRNHSLFLDLEILFRTVVQCLSK